MKFNTENICSCDIVLDVQKVSVGQFIRCMAYIVRTDVLNNFARDCKCRFGRLDIKNLKIMTYIDKNENSVHQIFDEKQQKNARP